MMPPPTMSMLLAPGVSANAPVESTMRSSSGKNGRRTACEPAAMMTDERMVCVVPVLSCAVPVPPVSSTCMVRVQTAVRHARW